LKENNFAESPEEFNENNEESCHFSPTTSSLLDESPKKEDFSSQSSSSSPPSSPQTIKSVKMKKRSVLINSRPLHLPSWLWRVQLHPK